MAVDGLLSRGELALDPLQRSVAAVSTGLVGGNMLLDLDYAEDSRASVDMNIVMDDRFEFIEIQGTGEMTSFSRKQLDSMLELAEKGIRKLFEVQRACLDRM
jgi:ribonuclease PH